MRARLEGKRVIICAGSGGVGKTTTSAALAMGLAAAGHRVAVVTIDPARRLADALGLDELDNEPRLVDPARLAGHGIEVRGELWAMMLDAKRTFDELIERLAPDERSRDEVLSNRIYQQLSGAVAGSQEFTAVAKLYELDRSGRYDVLVLDTPPSRNALDFLDAPDRLTSFFEGRAGVPRSHGARRPVSARTASSSISCGAVDLLDLACSSALGGLVEGRERARGQGACATTRRRSVTQHEPVEDLFAGQNCATRGCRSALVVNRVHPLDGGPPEADVDALTVALGDARLAGKVARAYAEERVLAERDAAAIAHLRNETGERDPVLVPQLDGDVHDVDGLVAIHRHLFASG